LRRERCAWRAPATDEFRAFVAPVSILTAAKQPDVDRKEIVRAPMRKVVGAFAHPCDAHHCAPPPVSTSSSVGAKWIPAREHQTISKALQSRSA
jgi:hypothetical protein